MFAEREEIFSKIKDVLMVLFGQKPDEVTEEFNLESILHTYEERLDFILFLENKFEFPIETANEIAKETWQGSTIREFINSLERNRKKTGKIDTTIKKINATKSAVAYSAEIKSVVENEKEFTDEEVKSIMLGIIMRGNDDDVMEIIHNVEERRPALKGKLYPEDICC
jgi:hypothetical protein